MATGKMQDHFGYPPRAFRADRAAAYLSIATSTFLKLVEEGVMPRGIRCRGMTMWDRFELDAAFENMKDERSHRGNPIEEHYGIANGG